MPSVATPRQSAAMLVKRGCRALYVLAELLCVLGLLVLCVLKVQHFLSFPVSTTVSYQRSRPPSITFCHQFTDQEAEGKLWTESWDGYSWLRTEVVKAKRMLLNVTKSVLSYSRKHSPQTIQNSSRPDSATQVPTLGVTKEALKEVLNQTEDRFAEQMKADRILLYSGMNDIKLLLRDVVRNSTVIFEEIREALEPPDLPLLTSLADKLESLINITDDIEARLGGSYEWQRPPQARLLVDGARRVDQFVISCRRGNTSCMPGEGGVWRLRHILETDERCYTLQAPDKDAIDEAAELVLELRGSKWREDVKDNKPTQTHGVTSVHSKGFSKYGDDASATTIETTVPIMKTTIETTTALERGTSVEGTTEPDTETTTGVTAVPEIEPTTEVTTVPEIEPTTEVTTVSEIETTTEVAATTTTATTETLPHVTLKDEFIPVYEMNSALEPTIYPHPEYKGSKPDPPPPILEAPPPIRVVNRPLKVTLARISVPPVYSSSIRTVLTAAPDSIQHVSYRVLIHPTPVTTLGVQDGLRERIFDIFSNQDWVEVDVRVEELRTLNRAASPCQEDPAYDRGSCLLECKAAAHARAAGCQLEAVWPATAQGLPQCETREQLERLRAKLETPPSCDCPRSCRQGRVSAVVQASSRTAEDQKVTVTVRLDADMLLVEESAAYTANSLLTDFGGNLGLTMGVSLLTVVELLKKITFGLLERKCEPVIPHENTEDLRERTGSMV